MKKLQLLFLPTILALAFGLMLSCSAKDENSSSGASSNSSNTVSGYVQKGPFIQGTVITVWELDSNLVQTGQAFIGTIDDNTGTFNVRGNVVSPYVELSAVGYYFNEVSGSLSTAPLTLQALSDLTDNSSVNVNLMTHLEKKRVEYLIDAGSTFAAAKTQAQTEIMKIFNIENVSLGSSETLNISKSGDGNAVLLAISAILQSEKTVPELTEMLSTINSDIRTDGTLDSTTTKATLVTAMEYLKTRHIGGVTIRDNIEGRYSNLGVSATIPAYESYVYKLDTIAPTVVSITPSDSANISSSSYNFSVTFSERMDNTTLTINTGLDCSAGQNGTSGGGMCRGTCSASFEYSSDDFVSCVQMTDMTLAVSNSGKTFTMNSSMHSTSTAYKFRVTSGAKDFGGSNSVSTHTVSYTTQ
jgi:hypothetical protein